MVNNFSDALCVQIIEKYLSSWYIFEQMNRQQKLTFLLRVHAGDAKLSPIDDAFLTAHAKGARFRSHKII